MSKHLLEENLRPEKLMADKERALEADRTFLLERKSQWVSVVCPACGEKEWRFYGEKHGFTYVTCPACYTVYMSPRPNASLLDSFYKQSQNYAHWSKHIFPATEAARRKQIHRPRAKYLEKICRAQGISGGDFLEVGAAYGSFCQEVAALKFFNRIIALEPTPDLAQICRDKGFTVVESLVERYAPNQFFDVVAAYEVIEHICDPAAFVRQCGRLLRSGGLLVLSCPNVQGFDVLMLGVLSGCFQHGHLNYFHPESLGRLFRSSGLLPVFSGTPGHLDAELVRKAALRGGVDLSGQPFLRRVLLDAWEDLGGPFQDFLADNGLSSHMVCVGVKK